MSGRGLWAVVPCKDLSTAKERLSDILTREERRALACAMLEDVLDALSALEHLAGTLVVTRDPVVSTLAASRGARILVDERQAGHSGAITAAIDVLVAEGARGMITVPGDVPLVTPAELHQVLAGHNREPLVTLVPALADRGTNAIASTPADAVPLCFGPGSFALHRAAARERGVMARTLVLPGLGLDLDRPSDVLSFLAQPSSTRSHALLTKRGVAARLRARGEGQALRSDVQRL